MKKQTSTDWQELEKQREQDLERQNALLELKTTLLERLIKNKDKNPAAATVLGQERRLEWLARGDASKREEAEDLLHLAASQGEPEACFTLANLSIFEPDWCTESEQHNFMRWAVRCGHEEARDFQERGEEGRIDNEDFFYTEWINDLNNRSKSAKETIGLYTPRADSGEPEALFERAKALLEKANISRESGEVFDSELGDKARRDLEAAAKTIPGACHVLAINWEHDLDVHIHLLKTAAYSPYGESNPKVFCDLADALETNGDPVAAESCLRQGMKEKNGDLGYKLAMLLLNYGNREAEQLVEVRTLLLESTNTISEYREDAALMAALMLIRGEGGEQDFNQPLKLFKLVNKSQHWGKNLTTFSAELALLLGWGDKNSFEMAVELMVRYLASKQFRAEPEIKITWDDINILIEHNPHLSERTDLEHVTNTDFGEDYFARRPPLVVFGWLKSFRNLIKAIYLLLKHPRIKQEELEALLNTPHSILENYLWGEVLAAGRCKKKDLKGALVNLNKAISFALVLEKTTQIGPKHLKSNEFIRWLVERITITTQQVQISKELQEEFDQELDKEAIRREVTENMMAMFAHKFRGTVDSIQFNAEHLHNESLYIDLAKTMNGLLEVFSIVSTKPELISESLQSDCEGTCTPFDVFTHSLKLALMQLCSKRDRRRMSGYYLAYAKKTSDVPLDLTLKDWCLDDEWQAIEAQLQSIWAGEIGALMIHGQLADIGEWMKSRLTTLETSSFNNYGIYFDPHGRKASLLTIIFTELLVNAIKHSIPGSKQPIIATWSEEVNEFVFSICNSSSKETRLLTRGSGSGHKFIDMIAKNMGGKFLAQIYKVPSCVSVHFPTSLIKGVA